MRFLRAAVLAIVPAYAALVAAMVGGYVTPDPLHSVAILAGFAALLAIVAIGAAALLAARACRAAARRLRAAPLAA